MTILEDIQNSAIDAKSDLATLLRKCKLLAARLGSQPLEDWVIWESNGYPENITVPDYRTWSLEVLGHFSGPFGRTMENVRIPVSAIKFIPQDVKSYYEHFECRQSVASIEEALRKADRENLAVSTGNLTLMIGKKLYQGYNCLHTWAEVPRGSLVELLNSVRNRVLDFSLAVWKEAPSAGELGNNAASNPEPKRVTQIFNTTVYSGSANLIGTATGSPITFNIEPKKFSTLERVLAEKGVSATDLSELKKALDSDPTPSKPESFGPKVSSWVGKMVEKAAQGSWKIGAGAAGNLLAEAIWKYYGL